MAKRSHRKVAKKADLGDTERSKIRCEKINIRYQESDDKKMMSSTYHFQIQ